MFLPMVSAIVLANLHITVQVLIDSAYMCTIIIVLKALHRNFPCGELHTQGACSFPLLAVVYISYLLPLWL